MDGDRIPMPFHAGELQAQAMAGIEPFNAPIRNRMPDQHRTFFPLLPFVCVAVQDAAGWPLATLVQGPPGFAGSPDPAQLDVAALPSFDDPVRERYYLERLREVPGVAVRVAHRDLGRE